MDRPEIHFVAFLEQDNLGVGYMTSVLLENGYHVRLIDFRVGKEAVLEQISRDNPKVVGFSVIFQYHIEEFRDLIVYLRRNGICSHFCAGGHYPSLRPRHLFEIIPQLDSIVLFEGESTFLKLVEAVTHERDWRNLEGVAINVDGVTKINPLRALEPDLDRYPPPYRPDLKDYALGKKYATLLAGRGCVYDCSFCSIRQFYSRPPGSVKRLRRPEMVVREMELLRDGMGCSVFLFQDDDFPVARPWGNDWTVHFCGLLEERGLVGESLWKINCRPDEIDSSLFRKMHDCGLFLVYLGIESGTEDGLALMNKHLRPVDNIGGVRILKDLGISYDYGFMLFDPSSTLDSVLANLDFLDALCGDGSSPITFCKMRPYAETKIEATLREQARLKGRVGFEDYDFIDDRVTVLYDLVTNLFAKWIGEHGGVLNMARWTRYYLAVYRKFFKSSTGAEDLEAYTKGLIQRSNGFLLTTLRNACDAMRERRSIDTRAVRTEMADAVRTHELQWEDEFKSVIDQIEARAAACETVSCYSLAN